MKKSNRLKEIVKASKEFAETKDGCYDCFIDGARWSDANQTGHIIDLIHQRSVAFDYGRDAIEALKELRKIGQMENNPHILQIIDKVLK